MRKCPISFFLFFVEFERFAKAETQTKSQTEKNVQDITATTQHLGILITGLQLPYITGGFNNRTTRITQYPKNMIIHMLQCDHVLLNMTLL